MSNSALPINFNNTEKAFAYKTDRDLKRARFLFSVMQFAPLVKLGTQITPWAIKSGLPVKGIIKNTLFKQFVGGETLEETVGVADMLEKFNVQVILDYGVEGGEGDEDKYEAEANYFIKVIQFAATRKNIPFISIKITGLVSSLLLEKLDTTLSANSIEPLVTRFTSKLEQLSQEEKGQWEQLIARTVRLCQAASDAGIGIMIDAEESWIQDAIDVVATQMMAQFNLGKVVVYNTIQLYRSDRLSYLSEALQEAEQAGYLAGLKLVRGAYMEKERARAMELGYPSPIQPSKESTDRDYDAAVTICIKKIELVSIIIASHNEKSNLLAANESRSKHLSAKHPHLHFSQLYGMSDNLTFNLADAGYNVSKYLPFGPVHEVIPYLMRRAEENSSVSGQTGRELELIKREFSRRKI
ncbi:MAG: proline dehydrogenase family protein [Chitinophagaceae bacterium]|nr:proline dehydrogenase family protein [Chitinophagaceae bacterium]